MPESNCLKETVPFLKIITGMIGRIFLRLWYLVTGQYIPPVYIQAEDRVENPDGNIATRFQNWCDEKLIFFCVGNCGKFSSIVVLVYFVLCSGIFGMLANAIPVVLFLYIYKNCSLDYRICYSIVLYGNNKTGDFPNIVLIDEDSNGKADSSLFSNKTIDNLLMFEDYSKLVLFLSSFSSFISYLLFFTAFTRLYLWQHVKRLAQENYKKEFRPTLWWKQKWSIWMGQRAPSDEEELIQPLHPFNDDDYPNLVGERQPLLLKPDNCTSTQLKWKEVPSYAGILLVNILINCALFAVFINYGVMVSDDKTPLQYKKKLSYKTISWEKVVLGCFVYSQCCTLSSCFLFSKLAYGIQRKCTSIVNYLEDIDKPNNELENVRSFVAHVVNENISDINDNTVRLLYLQCRDDHFIKVAKKTLRLFELWFFVHWILYIITSFFTLNLFLESLLLRTDARLLVPNKAKPGIPFSTQEIALLGLYCASNCLFFLYPCLRAAAITESRQALIRKINMRYSKHRHLIKEAPELKDKFINYLKNQDFGFKLQIMCAKVPFGYNVAYVSILISAFGILFKVATSV